MIERARNAIKVGDQRFLENELEHVIYSGRIFNVTSAFKVIIRQCYLESQFDMAESLIFSSSATFRSSLDDLGPADVISIKTLYRPMMNSMFLGGDVEDNWYSLGLNQFWLKPVMQSLVLKSEWKGIHRFLSHLRYALLAVPEYEEVEKIEKEINQFHDPSLTCNWLLEKFAVYRAREMPEFLRNFECVISGDSIIWLVRIILSIESLETVAPDLKDVFLEAMSATIGQSLMDPEQQLFFLLYCIEFFDHYGEYRRLILILIANCQVKTLESLSAWMGPESFASQIETLEKDDYFVKAIFEGTCMENIRFFERRDMLKQASDAVTRGLSMENLALLRPSVDPHWPMGDTILDGFKGQFFHFYVSTYLEARSDVQSMLVWLSFESKNSLIFEDLQRYDMSLKEDPIFKAFQSMEELLSCNSSLDLSTQLAVFMVKVFNSLDNDGDLVALWEGRSDWCILFIRDYLAVSPVTKDFTQPSMTLLKLLRRKRDQTLKHQKEILFAGESSIFNRCLLRISSVKCIANLLEHLDTLNLENLNEEFANHVDLKLPSIYSDLSLNREALIILGRWIVYRFPSRSKRYSPLFFHSKDILDHRWSMLTLPRIPLALLSFWLSGVAYKVRKTRGSESVAVLERVTSFFSNDLFESCQGDIDRLLLFKAYANNLGIIQFHERIETRLQEVQSRIEHLLDDDTKSLSRDIGRFQLILNHFRDDQGIMKYGLFTRHVNPIKERGQAFHIFLFFRMQRWVSKLKDPQFMSHYQVTNLKLGRDLTPLVSEELYGLSLVELNIIERGKRACKRSNRFTMTSATMMPCSLFNIFESIHSKCLPSAAGFFGLPMRRSDITLKTVTLSFA